MKQQRMQEVAAELPTTGLDTGSTERFQAALDELTAKQENEEAPVPPEDIVDMGPDLLGLEDEEESEEETSSVGEVESGKKKSRI